MDHEAGAGSARVVIPGGLDGFVCPDGHWRCAGQSGAGKQRTQQSAESICSPADCEFLLESNILQCPGFWLCVSLAAVAVDPDNLDDLWVLESGQTFCIAADSVFYLGHLCGLFELWCLEAELSTLFFDRFVL